jgi:hypothetical protein
VDRVVHSARKRTVPAMSRVERYTMAGFLVAWMAVAALPALAAGNVVVRQFDAGAGLNAVGVIDASEDTEIDVPQAIYSGDRGEIYLLDQVNGRVLRFDPKRPELGTRSLELPENLRPTDMIVRRSNILVWDGDVHTLQAKGDTDAPVRGLEAVSTRSAGNDELALSAFAQMGSQSPPSDTDLVDDDSDTRSARRRRPAANRRQVVDTRARGPVTADVIISNRTTAQVQVRLRGEDKLLAKLTVRVANRLGAIEFLEIDDQGQMFLFVENIPSTRVDLASASVARYSAKGDFEGVYDLPLSESVGLSRRFVTVSPEGDVYFLLTRKTGVDVLGVGFRKIAGRSPVIDHPGGHQIARSDSKRWALISALRPLTRKRVIDTAFAFEGVRWQLTERSYGNDPDQACTGFRRVRRPAYLAGKAGHVVRGIPYCWGCHGALPTILRRLEAGALAGNVCTRNEPRKDVVGVDCSAFVSAAWGLASHFTTIAIPAITRPLNDPWSLLPGDALNKPGSHVMLFLRFTADRKIEVMEAAPRACNGRVCRNVYPLAAVLARGYTPVRFRALANEPAPSNVSETDASAEAKPKAAKATKKRSNRKRRRR